MSILIKKDLKIKKALKLLQKTKIKILVVLDKNKKLLGTLTDGDIRRGFLKNISIEDKVKTIYNRNPKFLFEGKEFLKKKINSLPSCR